MPKKTPANLALVQSPSAELVPCIQTGDTALPSVVPCANTKHPHCKVVARELTKALGVVSVLLDDDCPQGDIQNCVLVRQRGGVIEFIGTDCDMQVRASVPLISCDGDFRVAIAGDAFYAVLARCAHELVEIVLEKDVLHICGDGFSFQLQTFPAGEYHVVPPVVATPERTLTLQLDVVKGLLDEVKHAMAADDHRSYLNGLYFCTGGRSLTLAATDGRRIALARAETSQELPEMEVIVPYLAVDELDRLMRAAEAPGALVEMRFAKGRACFNVNGFELVTELLAGVFPDVERLASAGYEYGVRCDRHALELALRRVAFGEVSETTLTLADGKLSVENTGGAGISATATLPVAFDGEPFQATLFNHYLLQAVESMSGGEVVVEFHRSERRVLLRTPGANAVRHVIAAFRR